LAAIALLSSTAPSEAGFGKGKPKATVELLASVASVAPGAEFELGIHFKIADGWHIYWVNSGESGMPPRIRWSLPDGFQAGRLEFPIPVRHQDKTGITTNVHEGEPVLIARVTAADSIDAARIQVKGKLRYLVCKEQCILENTELKLTLPVRSGRPEPANKELFAKALKALPKHESKYVSVTPLVAASDFSAGSRFDLVLGVEIAKGHHIQSDHPGLDVFVATEVFLEPTSGLTAGRPTYPKPHVRKVEYLGKVSEFSGKIDIKIPMEVDEAPQSGRLRFAGILKYQACTDAGRCYPPDAVSFETVVDARQSKAAPPLEPNPKTPEGTGAAATDASATASAPPAEPKTVKENLTPLPPTTRAETETRQQGDVKSVWYWLGFALLGGLILNIMPCVLPVISIKILSFVQQAAEKPRRVFHLGLAFSSGIVLSFLALAMVIIAIKATGEQVGWGFQFQNPTVVVIMIAAIFAFGLSLFGVFEITLPGGTVGHLAAAEEREGLLGAFMKGVLATVLATPCTAPFLGSALGLALNPKTSSATLVMIFAAAGVGMASPYVLLTWQPAWLKFMPRPGAWMERFKQFMGFVLMGTVVWLFYPLNGLIGAEGLIWTLAFLTSVGLAVWLLGLQTPLTPAPQRLLAWAGALAIVAGGWVGSFRYASHFDELMSRAAMVSRCRMLVQAGMGHEEDQSNPDCIPDDEWEDGIPWRPWSKGLPEQLAANGHTVYVDFTATWCTTCLANKKATLETPEIRKVMNELCVIPLKADFTQNDPDIATELQRFGRGGVPLNVIYPANRPDEPIELPEQLIGRTELVKSNLKAAGCPADCPNGGACASGLPGGKLPACCHPASQVQ